LERVRRSHELHSAELLWVGMEMGPVLHENVLRCCLTGWPVFGRIALPTPVPETGPGPGPIWPFTVLIFSHALK